LRYNNTATTLLPASNKKNFLCSISENPPKIVDLRGETQVEPNSLLVSWSYATGQNESSNGLSSFYRTRLSYATFNVEQERVDPEGIHELNLPGTVSSAYLRLLRPNRHYEITAQTDSECGLYGSSAKFLVFLPSSTYLSCASFILDHGSPTVSDSEPPRLEHFLNLETCLVVFILLAWFYLIYEFIENWNRTTGKLRANQFGSDITMGTSYAGQSSNSTRVVRSLIDRMDEKRQKFVRIHFLSLH